MKFLIQINTPRAAPTIIIQYNPRAASHNRRRKMENQKLSDKSLDLTALITELRKNRHELTPRMYLAQCCIRKDWEKAQLKWQILQAAHSLDRAWQLAQELKEAYMLIYLNLQIKTQKLLQSVDRIIQETDCGETANLMNLRQQSTQKLAEIHTSLEALAGKDMAAFQSLKEKPLCSCLNPRPQDHEPLGLDQTVKSGNARH